MNANTTEDKDATVEAQLSSADVSRVTKVSRVTILEMKKDENYIKHTNLKKKTRSFTGTDLGADTVSVAVHGVVIRHPTTYWETLLHLVKGNVGIGVFAMGDAYKNSGLVLGPLLTVVLGVVCVYGNHVLIRSARELAHRRQLKELPSFPDTCEWAFEGGPRRFQKYSKTVRLLVKIFNVVCQLGGCSVYIVFISHTLKVFLAHHGHEFAFHLIMVVVFLPILSTAMVRSLKFLVPFSMIANILTILGVFLTVFLSLHRLPPVTSRAYIAPLERLPLFFGVVMYPFSSVGMVLPLMADMKRPQSFQGPCGVLNVGMTIVCFLLIVVGFVGYLKYGEGVLGSVTLNLPTGVFSEIVQLSIAIGLLFSYPFQFYVGVCFVWPDIELKHGPFARPVCAELCVRLLMAFGTFVAAEAVPHLSLFISLIGCVCSTVLSLVFPALCDLALHWGQKPGPNYLFDAASLLLAVVGFCTGLSCSFKSFLDTFVFKRK